MGLGDLKKKVITLISLSIVLLVGRIPIRYKKNRRLNIFAKLFHLPKK